MNVKNYTLTDKLTFGKFKGLSIADVILREPGYIDWCLVNLEHFCITWDSLEEIQEQFPDFVLSEDGENARQEKDLMEETDYDEGWGWELEDYSGFGSNGCPACGESPCMCSHPFWMD